MRKILSLALSVLMLLSVLPMTALAASPSATYNQDGPVFSVTAANLGVTEGTELTFTATAYNGAGEVVGTPLTKSAAVAADGAFTSSVDFEEGNTEADSSIALVKVVVKNAGGEEVVPEKSFAVTANTAVNGDVSYPMTNGFYQPVTTYDYSKIVRYHCSENTGTDWGSSSNAAFDNNLATSQGKASSLIITGQIQVALTAATAIDRVVVYNTGGNSPDMQFYLSNITPPGYGGEADIASNEAYMAKFVPTTTEPGVYFLGEQDKGPASVDAEGARLCFDADGGSYQYLISTLRKTGEDACCGYIHEMQAYQKVQASKEAFAVVPSATYKQEGAVFSVTAANLAIADATELTFTATAYKADGTTVVGAPLSKTATVTGGAFAANVDFEEGDVEADNSIASVKVVVKNGDAVVVPEKCFAVTANVAMNGETSYPMTNGFYQPVTGYDYSKIVRYYCSENTGTDWGSSGNAAYDNDLATVQGKASGMIITGQIQVALTAATAIDRVVVYNTGGNAPDTQFYLSNITPPGYGGEADIASNEAYMAKFVPTTTEAGVYFLGEQANGPASVDADGARLWFDADGGNYQYLISTLRKTGEDACGGYIHEMQAYQKVVNSIVALGDGVQGDDDNDDDDDDEPVIPVPPTPPVQVETEEVAKGKAAFSYNSVAGTNPSMAIDGKTATAWQSKGAGTAADNFVIDLGADYKIDSIKVLPYSADSAKSITVYGGTKNAANATTAENQDKAKIAELNATSAELTELSVTKGTYRYITFEQAAGVTTPMAFSEIEVWAEKSDAVSSAEPVTLVSKGADVMALSLPQPFANLSSVTDDDPTLTAGAIGNATTAPNGIYLYADMGQPVKASYIAYQAILSEANLRGAQNFIVVGTNNEADFAAGTATVLATAGTAGISAAIGNDTGLWMFPVDSTTAYQYYGFVQKTPATGVKGLAVSTLQVYSKASDMAKLVTDSGVSAIVSGAKSEIGDTSVTYSANYLTGAGNGEAIGFFNHYDAEGNLAGSYTIGGGYMMAGYNNEVSFIVPDVVTEDKDVWELTIICGNSVIDYMSDVKRKTRPEAYGGAVFETMTYNQIGHTLTASGTVGAGVAAMLVLDKGASIDNYKIEDIISCQFAVAPVGATAPWNYSFRFTMPGDIVNSGAETNSYPVYFLTDNGALAGKNSTFNHYNVTKIVEDFIPASGNVAEGDVKTLVADTYAGFFGAEVKAAVTAASADFGKYFFMAKDGFVNKHFDDGLTSWSRSDAASINTITASVQAALVMDAIAGETKIAETVAAYGASMPKVFVQGDYNAEEFVALIPAVMDTLKPATAEAHAVAYKRAIGLSLLYNGELADRQKAIDNYSEALGILAETLDTEMTSRAIAEKLSGDPAVVTGTYLAGMDKVVGDLVTVYEEEGDKSEELGNDGVKDDGYKGSSSVATPPRAPSLGGLSAPSVTPGQSTVQTPVLANQYTDTANHGWALDAISTLSAKGILAGNGDGSFNPDGLLTREQAAKILVLVMNLPTSTNDNGYRDCAYGSWYYPYITAAKEHDLITGISRSDFGVGRYVTRQDLAVMIYRAMDGLGIVEEEASASFTDYDAVSDYAKVAVNKLGGMGLISGFADGSFGAGENTTRAQAAVMFARLLDRVLDTAEEVAAE